jgi:hypothetical protein
VTIVFVRFFANSYLGTFFQLITALMGVFGFVVLLWHAGLGVGVHIRVFSFIYGAITLL